MNSTATQNTAVDWGSFEPQVVKETDGACVIVWPQSASRILTWTEHRNDG